MAQARTASRRPGPGSTAWEFRGTPASFPEQRLVVAVVLAHELVERVVLRQQRKRPTDHPRPCEDVRILDDRFVLQRVEIRPPESLYDVQRLRMAIAVDFGLVVVANRVHDERVAFPSADGMAHPRGIG